MSMERMTPATEEVQEDIDINTREGLQAFSKYTEDTYTEIIERAKEDSSESVHATLEKATGLYDALKAKLDTAFEIKDNDEHIDEILADELQDYYNQLLDILDETVVIEEPIVEVSTAPEEPVSVEEVEEVIVVEKEVVPVVSEVEEVKEAIPAVKIIPIASIPVVAETLKEEPVAEITPAPEQEEVKTEEPVSIDESSFQDKEAEIEVSLEATEEKELILDEGEVVEKSILSDLKEEAEALIARAEAMLLKYQEITEVASSDAVINVGQHYYKQLGITTERTRTTLKNIESHLDKSDKVTELSSEHLDDTLDEISGNLDQLDKGLGGFFETVKDDTDPLTAEIQKRNTGSIEVAKEEVEEKVVPITLIKKVEEKVPERAPSQASVIHNAPIRPSGERVEKAFKGEWGSTIEKVLTIPRYSNFVAYTFTSPVQFDAMLRREINRIEAPSKFDTTFGFTNKSAFNELLRDMTVKEVVDFDNQPREVIRAELQERDIKYEVYLDWIDSLNSMLTITHVHPTMKFGELFVRAELETLLQHHEAMAA
jgi:hypothetical protein